MKLSIIVPAYNVEKYLRKCVDSLLAQDLPSDEYEIILIDDGSEDSSGAIADEYTAQYDNISVIHQSNLGLSEARNAGIRAAQGKYIQFVDSDDYLELNVLGGLVQKMDQDNLDVLRFNYQNVNEKYEVFEPNKVSKPFVDYRDEVCDGLTFLTERLGYGCYAVQFMIKCELLIDCMFKPGIYFEDTEWTPRMLLRVSRVTSVDTMVYNYLLRVGSITQSISEEKKRKVLRDKFSLISDLQQQAEQVDDRRWFDGMIASIVIGILSVVTNNFYKERHTYMAQLRELNVISLSDYHLSPSARTKRNIINISPELFCWLIHIKNK